MPFANWLYSIPMRIRSLFRRNRMGAELDEELHDHLDRQIEDNISRGMSAEEARLAALRTLGNPALVRDQTRASWSWNALEHFFHDLRIGVRTLTRTPSFAIVAVFITALGIGASVALFTVVRGVLLRPLPFPDSDRLLMLYEHSNVGDFPYNLVAGGVYSAWNKENSSFSSLALVREDSANLSATGGQLPETLNRANVSWNMFPTLGVSPALGHGFTAADDSPNANGTVVLSWSLFKRRFAANPAILNQTIYIDAKPYTVIGVMPEWFQFPDSTIQLWTPVFHEMPPDDIARLDFHNYRVVGRLKPGVTAAEATQNLSIISRRLHNSEPEDPFINASANSRPLLEHMVGDVKRPLYVMFAATGCLLLIACLNVANLLVARSAARRKELAIRTALGGGRMRLIREHLMESFLLQATGGAIGLALAWAAIDWLIHTRDNMARVRSIHIDGVVVAFAVGVIVVCAIFSGLVSALNTDSKRLLGALQESSRGHSAGSTRARLRKSLLAIEVGLTVVLLMGACLLLRSYQRLRATALGCITQNVL
ncbi:MAG TPA: ABC transporter permease, partial [Terracidiphilus sp.]|nr:ABC transporter permease [Terracidiphilus sp.]